MKVIVGKTRCYTVIEDHAVFVQHQPVAASADGELLPVVGVDHLQEPCAVSTLDVYFAECGCIEHTHTLTYCVALPLYSRVKILTLAWEVPGSFPVTDIFEHCVVVDMALMHWRVAFLQKKLAGLLPAYRTKRQGCVRRPECRGTDFGNLRTTNVGHNRQCIQIGGLTLIGCHAGCGIAF